MKPADQISQILDLRSRVNQIGREHVNFRELWDYVKSIQRDFNATDWENKDQRQTAWNKFQDVVAELKSGIDRSNAERSKKFSESESVRDSIIRLAQNARPSTSFENAVFDLFTMGIRHIVTAAVNMLPGPEINERQMELEACTRTLQAGWAMLKEEKSLMIGLHRKEAFNELMDAKEKLDSAWAEFKDVKQKIWEAKNAAWEERQAEYHRKREAFVDRVEGNIAKNEERLEKAEAALGRAENHLSDLYDKLSDANSASYRERVEGWISEAEDRISSIKSSIDRLEDWIREDRAKLT